MNGQHHAVPASYVILRDGDGILLTLRKNTGYYDGWYTVPSGHVEAGEMPLEAAIREAKEEVGVDLTRASVRQVHAMYRTKTDETGDRADYFFEADVWQGEPINAEPEKCESIGWFPIGSLPVNLMHHVRLALESVGARSPYSELGLDRVMRNPSR